MFEPKYHIFPIKGWMNDPNGLVYFKGQYHVFYQYYPKDSQWGPMHWGHVVSKDLIHWKTEPIALYPDIEDGCFSGSAIVKDNNLFLIYTSHNENKDGLITENQKLAISEDGIHFAKFPQPIIVNDTNDIHDFRDPKVFERDGKYYTIVGTKNKENMGQVKLYSSPDLYNWKFCSILTQSKSTNDEGYMWECPDIFRINGEDVLLFSPQGIKAKETEFKNLYQTGYLLGQMDWNARKLVREKDFKELDSGHDFYATQTFLTPDGRRILFGWLDMWESKFKEQEEGWAGMLTFPRELLVQNDRLIQRPIKEINKLYDGILAREESRHIQKQFDTHQLEIDLANKQITNNFEMKISYGQQQIKLTLKDDFLILNRTDSTNRFVKINTQSKLRLQILCDTSSVEIFVNDGIATFSERLYGSAGCNLEVKSGSDCSCLVRKLSI